MKACSMKRIREANAKAVGRMMASEPMLFDIQRALYAIPGMRQRMLLHAGPPIAWKDMCGAMKGAIAGAIIFERWASSYDEAIHLAGAGVIQFRPTHDHCAVSPMAGIISPSMHVLCVKNITFGNLAYSNLNEGLGRVVRFGAYAPDVIDNLRWVNEWVGPILRDALQVSGPIPLKPIMVEAMKRGDECHNRHVAGNGLFIDLLRPFLLRAALTRKDVLKVLEFIERNYYSFLNISLAACKSMADAAAGVPNSTIVSALSRNGKDTGIRVSGLGNRWFTAPSSVPTGRMFEGHRAEDGNPDMGDSTITETVGIGAFAMAAAPEIVSYLGGESDEVIAHSQRMYDITFAEHSHFRIPHFGNRGTPLGIDLMRVCEVDITPIINTGIAHKSGGIGQIGAGFVHAPLSCFRDALTAFEECLLYQNDARHEC
jgi:Protein of unknown function (DUF1116)